MSSFLSICVYVLLNFHRVSIDKQLNSFWWTGSIMCIGIQRFCKIKKKILSILLKMLGRLFKRLEGWVRFSTWNSISSSGESLI